MNDNIYKEIIDQFTYGVIIVDDGVIKFSNQYFKDLVKLNDKEIYEKTIYDFFIKKENEKILKYYNSKVFPSTCKTLIKSHNDSNIFVQILSNLINIDNKIQIISIIKKIVSKIYYIDQILINNTLEQINDSFIITDRNGNIYFVNDSVSQNSGYSKNELIGKNCNIFKSGEQDNSFYKEMWNCINKGEIWKSTFINKKKNGIYFEEEITISPIRNSKGNITHFVAIKRDITEQAIIEKQLYEFQKMEAIKTLTRGFAQDLDDYIGAVVGYTDLVLLDVRKNSITQRNLKQILNASKKAKKLFNQLLLFSNETNTNKRPVELSLILAKNIENVIHSLPDNIKFNKNIKSKLSLILASSSQIHEVINNLFSNAIYAMKEKGGVLSVEINEYYSEINSIITKKYIEPGKYIRLTISDTGCGIDPSCMQNIFEPYFTTKKNRKGLGLSIVYSIVKAHKGETIVYSEVNKGSKFHILLPKIENINETFDKDISILPSGKENILFVDDEKVWVDIGIQMLSRLGYNISARTSSIEALEAFKSSPYKFDLIITDYLMPNMTGIEFAKQILNIRSEIPVILLLNFSQKEIIDKALTSGIKNYIMKPFIQKNLSHIIKKVMN